MPKAAESGECPPSAQGHVQGAVQGACCADCADARARGPAVLDEDTLAPIVATLPVGSLDFDDDRAPEAWFL